MASSWSRRAFLASTLAAFGGARAGASSVRRGGVDFPASFLGEAVLRGHRTRGVDPRRLPVDREPTVDVFVAGAGFAGLVAATSLRAAGVASLYVAELDDVPGGHAQRRTLGGVAVQFGPQAFDAPTTDADRPADYDAFLAARVGGTAPRAPRLRRRVDGGFDYGDPDGSAAECVARCRAAFGDAAGYAGRRRAALLRDGVDGETFLAAERFPASAASRLRLYARARFGLRADGVSAGVLVEDFLRRGPACEGRRLFPAEGPGGVAAAMASSLGESLRLNRVVLRIERDGDGVQAYVVDPATNYVERVRARAAVAAVPPFTARELCPELGADGRFAAPAETTVWLQSAFGLRAPPASWDRAADLDAPGADDSSALQRLFAAPADAAPTADPLRPPFQWLDLRPFPGAAAMPPRIMISRAMPWELRDYVLREQSRLRPDLAALATRVDFLRTGHGPLRPAPGALGVLGPAWSRPAPPFFPAGADWTGAPSLEAAIVSGAAAARAVVAHLAGSASRPESRPR